MAAAAKILIVDDEIIIARELEARLLDLGYEVTGIASSGREAITLAEQTYPQLVLMDIVLKGDMDGIEAAVEIRRRWSLPVIYLSAYADKATLQRARITEPYGYIVKPISEQELQANIEIALYKHQAETKLRLIVDTAYDAFVAIDSAGRIVDWNPQACATFGWTRDEALGRALAETIIPLQYRQAHSRGLARFLETGEGPVLNKRIELTALHRDGREFPVELTISAVDSGQTPVFCAFVHDITERKHAEVNLARRAEELARSNAELEQFAYVASHDLREPLRMVQSFCGLLQDRYGDQFDERANKYIDFAVDGAARMQRLVDDLLEFSRVGRSNERFESVSLDDVVRQASTNLEAAIVESGATIEFDRLPTIRGNAMRLSQVFQNLIGNAIKFRGADPPEIEVTACRDGDAWQITVADNGIGIDPKHFPRLFVVFQRLHTKEEYPGTGIGLALCKRIVELHGGRIWLDSQPGRGTSFHFRLLPAEKSSLDLDQEGAESTLLMATT